MVDTFSKIMINYLKHHNIKDYILATLDSSYLHMRGSQDWWTRGCAGTSSLSWCGRGRCAGSRCRWWPPGLASPGGSREPPRGGQSPAPGTCTCNKHQCIIFFPRKKIDQGSILVSDLSAPVTFGLFGSLNFFELGWGWVLGVWGLRVLGQGFTKQREVTVSIH